MDDKTIFEKLLDDLLVLANHNYGSRIKDGKCFYCGAPLDPTNYCTCPKSQDINKVARKLNKKAEFVHRMKLIKINDHELFLYDTSGIPERYKGKTINDYKPSTPEEVNIKKEVQKYQYGLCLNWLKGRNLILTGNSGTAKTHFLAALAEYGILKKGFNCKFVCSTDLFFALKATFKDVEKSEYDILAPYINADILFFDDIDKEPLSPYVAKTIYDIVNKRSCAKLPTVISSNHSLEELETYWGDRGEMIASRLGEDSVCIEFNGENYRIAG